MAVKRNTRTIPPLISSNSKNVKVSNHDYNDGPNQIQTNDDNKHGARDFLTFPDLAQLSSFVYDRSETALRTTKTINDIERYNS